MAITTQNKPDPPKIANSEGRLLRLQSWLGTILSTAEERHAFLIGICEVLCPLPPRVRPWDNTVSQINAEYHYYVAGRALAALCWVVMIALFVRHLL